MRINPETFLGKDGRHQEEYRAIRMQLIRQNKEITLILFEHLDTVMLKDGLSKSVKYKDALLQGIR